MKLSGNSGTYLLLNNPKDGFAILVKFFPFPLHNESGNYGTLKSAKELEHIFDNYGKTSFFGCRSNPI